MLNREKIMTRLTIPKTQPDAGLPDATIIRQAIKDPAKFSALYRQYVTKVYRYIYARVSNHADAEDLTSQVFEVVLKRLPTFRKGGNFNAWLFTIARNKIVDSYRAQRPVVPLEAIQNVPLNDSDPFTQLAQEETRARLGEVLHELTQDQQELLQLRFAAELSFAEIGMVTGKSEAAVKMSVYRLLDKLQEKMEKSDE